MERNSLYTRSSMKYAAKMVPFAEESFKAFRNFDKEVLTEGHLTHRFKEILAVALTQITACPYCIEVHVKNAKKLNVSLEELIEGTAVAASVKSHSAYTYGINVVAAYSENLNDELFPTEYNETLETLQQTKPELSTAFNQYVQTTLQPGLLSAKEKLIIAVACANILGAGYSIDYFTKQAKGLNISLEELTEAILVSTVLKAGSASSYRINVYKAYEL